MPVSKSDILRQKRQQYAGDDAGDGQRQTADRTGKLAQLHGLGGADDVGGGAEGYTLCNFVIDAEKLAQRGIENMLEATE